MEDDFEDEFKDELENLSREIIGMLADDILDEAYYNSYLVITERMTFQELVDDDGKTLIVAHDPEKDIEKDLLISMIRHYSSPDKEEYEKCGELLKRLHLLYPETEGKQII